MLPRQQDVYTAPTANGAEVRRLQREAKAGTLYRIGKAVYIPAGTNDELIAHVRRHWQKIAGALVPGAVVSHISALTNAITPDLILTLSHPVRFNTTVKLPGLTLILLKGPSNLPGDMPLSDTGLYWASRPRALLENFGNVRRVAPRRIGRKGVEECLVNILNAAGEAALNKLREDAALTAPLLSAQAEFEELNKLISALLGTYTRKELRTRSGALVAQGTPVDKERMARFEVLATHLRPLVVPLIADVAPTGNARLHFAFMESYFSNYVEGTKFSVEQAREIALRNEIVTARPKDSHDILGVLRLATSAPYRNSVPPAGSEFLPGLQAWHAEMLKNRPEANPGEMKTQVNYAGTTKFVEPSFVRGTLAEASPLAMSIPEGLARAIYYAFLVSEAHPFEDGNGRLSRLLMNAELSRLGQCRVIIPTLYHQQYVDCARQLTRQNEPAGFAKAIIRMARWCAQFSYADLDQLIADLTACNAFEESAINFQLLDYKKSVEGKLSATNVRTAPTAKAKAT